MPPLELEIAYHEAGHYIARRHLRPNASTYDLTIVPKGDDLGSALEEYPEDEELDAAVVGAFAGYAAQVRFNPSCEERARAGAASDDEHAEKFMQALGVGDEKRAEHERSARSRAAALVAERWGEVELIAEELFERRMLSGEEADLMLGAAIGDEEAERALKSLRALHRQRSMPPTRTWTAG